MKSFTSQREKLLAICDKALSGELSADEFYNTWPDDIESSDFVLKLYDDIEDGVLHFPGHFFTNKPDYKTWQKSYMYMVLYLDKLLLSSMQEEDELLRMRDYVLSEEKKLTTEKIDVKFKKYSKVH